MWGVAARPGRPRGPPYGYPATALDEAWSAVLLNQFHDIIPGSSIHRVYEEAEAATAKPSQAAQDARGAARPLRHDRTRR